MPLTTAPPYKYIFHLYLVKNSEFIEGSYRFIIAVDIKSVHVYICMYRFVVIVNNCVRAP